MLAQSNWTGLSGTVPSVIFHLPLLYLYVVLAHPPRLMAVQASRILQTLRLNATAVGSSELMDATQSVSCALLLCAAGLFHPSA